MPLSVEENLALAEIIPNITRALTGQLQRQVNVKSASDLLQQPSFQAGLEQISQPQTTSFLGIDIGGISPDPTSAPIKTGLQALQQKEKNQVTSALADQFRSAIPKLIEFIGDDKDLQPLLSIIPTVEQLEEDLRDLPPQAQKEALEQTFEFIGSAFTMLGKTLDRKRRAERPLKAPTGSALLASFRDFDKQITRLLDKGDLSDTEFTRLEQLTDSRNELVGAVNTTLNITLKKIPKPEKEKGFFERARGFLSESFKALGGSADAEEQPSLTPPETFANEAAARAAGKEKNDIVRIRGIGRVRLK